MAESRKTYWEKRMEQLYDAQNIKKLEKKLRREYQRLAENLKKEIAAYYQKYGKDNVIDYRELVKSLSQAERDMLYRDMNRFVAKHPDLAHLIPIRESIYKLNRLEGLELSIRLLTLDFGAMEQEEILEFLQQAYESGYLSSMKGLENAPSFFDINRNAMMLTINEKWTNGENYSDRVWKNKERLINSINTYIRDGIIRGDSYRDMAKMLTDRTDVGMNETLRLIYTESAFVLNQANKQAFIDAGIKRYQISAVLDQRTSPTCRRLNGEIFEFGDAKVGVNYPPFHPWCRTTVIPLENE